jgi:predicted RNA-binding Zn ribbon-like protein
MNATGKIRAYYSPIGRIRMLGGDRALDLANTLHWNDGHMVDFIPDYEALVKWCVPALLLGEGESLFLLRLAKQDREQAAAIHGKWTDLRASLKSWLSDTAVNRKALKGMKIDRNRSYSHLIAALDSSLGSSRPEELLAVNLTNGRGNTLSLPLLRSAAAILSLALFPPAGAIRQCEADQCGGFFLDQSRAKPRRWCSMDTCGNRAKAARHRRNKQAE